MLCSEQGLPHEINFNRRVAYWRSGLTGPPQEDVTARVQLLEEHGLSLGRTMVDRVTSSADQNMKELRCSSDGVLRVLFAFDPRPEGTLPLGGDMSGESIAWYDKSVAKADQLFARWLRELRREGLIA